MNNNVQTPRGRAILIGLCAAVLIAWAVAVYVTYQDSKITRYDVAIKPGTVTIGTRSSVTMPMVSVSSHRSSIPMVSGGAIRSYAHHGHATMPSTTSGSGFRMHTTSSATVHSIGGGGNAGGRMMGSSSSISSSRGIQYSGGSFSVPNMAMVTPSFTSSASTISRYGIGPRKAKPGRDGNYNGEELPDTEDPYTRWTWSDAAEDWVNTTPVGTKKYDSVNGYMVEWNGSEWVKVENQNDPSNVPVGTAPWMLMLLLGGAYTIFICRKIKRHI